MGDFVTKTNKSNRVVAAEVIPRLKQSIDRQTMLLGNSEVIVVQVGPPSDSLQSASCFASTTVPVDYQLDGGRRQSYHREESPFDEKV